MSERRSAGDGRHALKVLAGPLLAYFDNRFQDLNERIDDRMNELYARVATEVETMSEMTLVMQRFVDVAAARMDALAASIEARGAGTDPVALEEAFAMAAVGRLPAGARILYVGEGRLPATLAALGYDVSTPDGAGAGPFDCVLCLAADLDDHDLDLLAKSLDPGGELVLSLRHDGTQPFPGLPNWGVVEHHAVAGGLDLVRAAPVA